MAAFVRVKAKATNINKFSSTFGAANDVISPVKFQDVNVVAEVIAAT
jgi:hypothetical protein